MNSTQLRVYRGATALITGGASGIGRALGEELALRGSEVFLADLQGELAEEVAAGIRSAGGKATACRLNVSDYLAVEALVREAFERTGRLDFIFNNAGISIGATPEAIEEDWRRIIDVNLYGVVHGVQAAYPIMLRQGFGHIVNTASMGAFIPIAFAIPYSTTKHAILGLTKSLRAAAACEGIRVSVLCPGAVRTPTLIADGEFCIDRTGRTKKQHTAYWEKYKPIDVKSFAREALKAIARNQAIIIVPSWWKLYWWMERLSPTFLMKYAQKDYEELFKLHR